VPQVGKIVAGLVMDSVHPLYAMIVIMITVAAANAAFTFGNSILSLAVLWCLGRIVHVRPFCLLRCPGNCWFCAA